MDAVAAAVLVEIDLAQFAVARLGRGVNGSIGCMTCVRAGDDVVGDAGAVRLADVDAVQRRVDAVVCDHRARAGDVDGGVVLPEVEAGPADLEPVDGDVGGAYGHRVGRAVAEQVRRAGGRAGAPADRS